MFLLFIDRFLFVLWPLLCLEELELSDHSSVLLYLCREDLYFTCMFLLQLFLFFLVTLESFIPKLIKTCIFIL